MTAQIKAWILILFLLIPPIVHGETGLPLTPGEYVREGNSGALSLKRINNGQLSFSIDAIGSNCHVCDVSGAIRGSQGIATDNNDCRISFATQGTALEIMALNENCREFCGMRANFDGKYLIPPPKCTEPERKAARKRFLVQYKAHKYAPARKILEDLLAQCPAFMDFIEQDEILNDVALAYLHGRNPTECLNTLAKTLAGTSKKEDLPLPPCESDKYAEIAEATWFNQNLCQKALSRSKITHP